MNSGFVYIKDIVIDHLLDETPLDITPNEFLRMVSSNKPLMCSCKVTAPTGDLPFSGNFMFNQVIINNEPGYVAWTIVGVFSIVLSGDVVVGRFTSSVPSE